MAGILCVYGEGVENHQEAFDELFTSTRKRGLNDSFKSIENNCVLGSVSFKKGFSDDLRKICKDFLIGFDGNLSNVNEIKSNELKEVQFKTSCHEEVVLELYLKYKTECVKFLRGSFAFVIYNKREKKVFSARDHFGQKPLYYFRDINNLIYIASDVRTLLQIDDIHVNHSEASLKHFLQKLYIPSDSSFFKEINPLPAAHTLDIYEDKIELNSYWQLPKDTIQETKSDAVECFKHLFEQAVARTVPSKLSSTIYGNNEDTQFANYFFRPNTDFVEFKSELSSINKLELLRNVSENFDEPFADISGITSFQLCQSSTKDGDHLLSFSGMNECLGGYADLYRPLWYMRKYIALNPIPLGMYAFWVNYKKKKNNSSLLSQKSQGLWYLLKGYSSVAEAHMKRKFFFSDNSLSSFSSIANYNQNFFDCIEDNTLNDAMRIDIKDSLVGKTLYQLDRASSAHGIDVVSPFLDVDLASYLISLPEEFKINEEFEKILLRDSFTDLPHKVGDYSKQSNLIYTDFLEDAEVNTFRQEVFRDKNHPVFHYLPYDFAQQNAYGDTYRAYILLCLACWAEHYG